MGITSIVIPKLLQEMSFTGYTGPCAFLHTAKADEIYADVTDLSLIHENQSTTSGELFCWATSCAINPNFIYFSVFVTGKTAIWSSAQLGI